MNKIAPAIAAMAAALGNVGPAMNFAPDVSDLKVVPPKRRRTDRNRKPSGISKLQRRMMRHPGIR